MGETKKQTEIVKIKKRDKGDSLVQWLRLPASTAEGVELQNHRVCEKPTKSRMNNREKAERKEEPQRTDIVEKRKD